MSFANIKSMIDQFWNGGQEWTTYWTKTTGSTAYTAGRYYDLTMLAGNPRPNVYPGSMGDASPMNCIDSSNYKTSIYHNRNVSPHTKHILTAMAYSAVSTAVPSTLTLCDYLLFYPLIDLDDDGLQTLTNATNQLTRYTDGKGVMAYLLCTADTGANVASINYSYINQNGETRTNAAQVNLTASSITGQIVHSGVAQYGIAPFLPLAPGDIGIRQMTSIQLSAGMGGGWGCLVLVKPLLTVPLFVASVPSERCYFSQLPSLPKVYDGAYLGYILFAGAAVAAATPFYGSIQFIWGT